MKNSMLSFQNIRIEILLIYILSIFFNSCGNIDSSESADQSQETTISETSPELSEANETNLQSTTPQVKAEENPTKSLGQEKPTRADHNLESKIVDTNSISLNNNALFDNFSILLFVNSKIYLSETCELTVHIGPDTQNFSVPEGMNTDKITYPARIGQYAKVTPTAPGFEITPKEMKCILIDPSGSDVRFILKPQKSGTLKVSANVELYNNADCAGPPVPKTTKTLTVLVDINKKEVFYGGINTMLAVVWDKFLSFWTLLIALVFSVMFFLVRKVIKKKTGYDDIQKD